MSSTLSRYFSGVLEISVSGFRRVRGVVSLDRVRAELMLFVVCFPSVFWVPFECDIAAERFSTI